jgi:hypothetical protein
MKKLTVFLSLVLIQAAYAEQMISDGMGGYYGNDGYYMSDGMGGLYTPQGEHIMSDGMGGFYQY